MPPQQFRIEPAARTAEDMVRIEHAENLAVIDEARYGEALRNPKSRCKMVMVVRHKAFADLGARKIREHGHRAPTQ
jgi:hypothetical protein